MLKELELKYLLNGENVFVINVRDFCILALIVEYECKVAGVQAPT